MATYDEVPGSAPRRIGPARLAVLIGFGLAAWIPIVLIVLIARAWLHHG